MKLLPPILATVVALSHAQAAARGDSMSRESKRQAADQGGMALASYYGLRHPQNFIEARKRARLAGGEVSGIVVEALCLGRGKGGAQDTDRALKLLAPLLLKGEPVAQAVAAVIMGWVRSADAPIPAAIATEFHAELATVPACNPAARGENARLALAGLRSRLETDAVACLLSAQLLGWGAGLPKNEARAEELLRRAWKLGCSDAANHLGLLFNEREPAQRDKAEATRWFRQAAEAGNVVAKFNLAQFDPALAPEAARALMTEAADAGYSDAMTWLGAQLWIGTRLAKDLPAAREWLEKAAACGRGDGMAQLGKMLREAPANDAERERGTRLLRQAAARGSALAQNYLAFPFLLGEPDLPANPEVGYLLALMAADAGQHDAWSALGLAFEKGLGVPKNLKAARKCLETGAARGSAATAYNLACFLVSGTDGEPDEKLAFQHFLAAAESGTFPLAMAQVGARLLDGAGVEKDAVAGVAWLRKAVAERDGNAMNRLGIALEKGEGVAADLGGALKLYHEAAEAGSPAGMVNLANSLQQGKGQPADPEAAFPWWLKAGGLETKEAFIWISRAYENGIGTKSDPVEAWKWLVKAAEAGSPEGCYWLGEGYRTGRMGESSWEKAADWYTKAAKLNHPTGTNNLGCCYQFGNGVSPDPDRAFALYTRAAELGDPMAIINLAICHEKGIGTPVNLEKAREYRRQAAARAK